MKLLSALFLVLIVAALSVLIVPPTKADDLIIQDSGAVILIITNNQVLAESTSATKTPPKKEEPKPAPTPKTETLAPANTPSTVKINPKTTSDKKIEVTVSPSIPDTRKPAVTKTVDKVVAQGVNGKAILTITPNTSGQITINQGSAAAQTNLPLQINTTTHTISNGPNNIFVLPKEAADGASKEINNGIDKINLISQDNSPVYDIQGSQKGRLLGILPVQSAISVNLSAQTGRITHTSQSPLFSVFKFLIQ